MLPDTPDSVSVVPIDRIEVLNSRDRKMKIFEEIVENIRCIGLKKPITVTEREGADGSPAFLLEKGEERLIEAVQNNTIPLTAALEIARANIRPV